MNTINSLDESPFPISCAIRVQPLWKQWTVFSLICGLCGHNGRCDTLWTPCYTDFESAWCMFESRLVYLIYLSSKEENL